MRAIKQSLSLCSLLVVNTILNGCDSASQSQISSQQEQEGLHKAEFRTMESTWRLTFADEFNGMQPGDNPECFNRPDLALCANRNWSVQTCEDAIGPQGVDPDLNTCNWVVFNQINWMSGGGAGERESSFDASLVEVKDGYLSLPARYNPNHGSCDQEIFDADGDGVEDQYKLRTTNCRTRSGGVWSKKMGTWKNGSFVENEAFSQQYGRFEVRAQIPTQQGSFPAHWLLPQGGNWPEDGEIDIMEFRWKGNVHGTFHGGRAGDPKWKHAVAHQLDDVIEVSDESLNSQWHTYAVEWSPEEIRFYFDNVHYGTMDHEQLTETYEYHNKTKGDSVGLQPALVPNMAFFLILNTTVHGHDFGPGQPSSSWAGLEHKIDYVRVYERCELGETDCEVLSPWDGEHGDGSGRIKWWNMSDDDTYLSGDYDGDGRDELIALNSPWVHLMERNDTNSWSDAWNWRWGTGSGRIASWNMSDDDIYLSGNFMHESGTPRSELLSINDPWAHLMYFDGNTWKWKWGTGTGKIYTWNMSDADQHVVGDFDGDGIDEVLFIKAPYAHILKFNGSDWSHVWYTDSGSIHWWNLNPGDRFVAGDFDADGRDELLAINGNWAQLMSFTGNSWKMNWGNDGDGSIYWWDIDSANDNYTAASLMSPDQDLLIATKEPWSHVMRFDGKDWNYEWGTYGGKYDGWFFHPGDKYVPGDWNQDGQDEILAIQNPHWQLLNYLNDDTYWTSWLNRDRQSGSGDYELLSLFSSSQVCEEPLAAVCETTSGIALDVTQENGPCNAQQGFYCRHTNQSDGRCNYDYRVKFLCQ